MKKKLTLLLFILLLFLYFYTFLFISIQYNIPTISPKISSNKILFLNGSSSMQEICDDFSIEFTKKFPNTSVIKSGNGSSEAVLAIKNKTAQIGDLSRPLEKTESPSDFNIHIIALDGIAICANINNKIKNISKKDLVRIFKKEITNWNQIGGDNKKIILIGRDYSSGTRRAFENALNISDLCKYDVEFENNGKVKFKLLNDEGAIGYLSYSCTDNSINILSIDNIKASSENFSNFSYPIIHPLIQITNKNICDPLIDNWFSFVFSKKGSDILKRNKLIAVPKN